MRERLHLSCLLYSSLVRHSINWQSPCSWKCHHPCFQARSGRSFVAKGCWNQIKAKKFVAGRGEEEENLQSQQLASGNEKKVIFTPFWIIATNLPLFITIHCINPKADPYVNTREKKSWWLIDFSCNCYHSMWVFVGYWLFFLFLFHFFHVGPHCLAGADVKGGYWAPSATRLRGH